MIAAECGGWRVRAMLAIFPMLATIAAGVPAASSPPLALPDLQVGVLGDGFVAAVPTPGGVRVIELAANGETRRGHDVAVDGDARVVGTTAGAAVGVLDGGALHLVSASTGEDLGAWGRNARRLCDGAASNAARFGVAWLDGDDKVWVVHGPTARPEPELAATAAAPTWCGVASAGDNLMLMWRDRARLYFNTCTRTSCRGPVSSLDLDARVALLGVGCVDNGCLIATRKPDQPAQLQLVTPAGSIKWRAPLDTAAPTVSIAGTDRGFVVGCGITTGLVRAVSRDGKSITELWRGDGAPIVAWARGRVLIARRLGDALVTTTVGYPAP
jgi:hypothetical protein